MPKTQYGISVADRSVGSKTGIRNARHQIVFADIFHTRLEPVGHGNIFVGIPLLPVGKPSVGVKGQQFLGYAGIIETPV